MEPNQEHDIPAVDQIANGENLQMYKAMIPYFPKNMQRTLALLIKMAEMNHLLSFYNSPMSACAMPEIHNPEEILSQLRQYGNDRQNQQIDQIFNLITMLKLYQTYNE